MVLAGAASRLIAIKRAASRTIPAGTALPK
jgi:hypothetical protein